MQSQWFVQMFSRIEQKTGTIISNGRMDQYLYPYFKKDMEEGRITEESAMELLECMWVAMAQFIDLVHFPEPAAPSTKATPTGKRSPSAARPRPATTPPMS